MEEKRNQAYRPNREEAEDVLPHTSQTWTLPMTLLSYLKRFNRHKHCFSESKKPQQALASQ